MKKLRIIITLLFYHIAIFVFGQLPKYPVVNLPVVRNGIILQNPWTGGMNSPQFSPIDLNNDGIDDLFAFDRAGDKVLTFINDGSHSDTAFHYAPEYESFFPKMYNWALVRDYNHDGVPYIFTYQPGEVIRNGEIVPVGIKVYKGTRVGNTLHFEVLSYCLEYFSNSFTAPVYVNLIDIPAIVDVNNDGDLDILSFGYFGSEVEYFENQMKEQNLPADSIAFNEITSCWGNFSESASGMQVTLNISCKGTGAPIAHNGTERHVGAGLCPIFNENNRDINLLLGGIGYDYMYLANNCGDSAYANMCWVDTLWPKCNNTVHFPFFPTAYQVDADNDGHADLLIAPNAASSAADINNVMLYRNTPGDTCNYQDAYTDSFLVRTSMDLGTDSKATFFDYNGDGLMDIVVGNYGYFVRSHPYVSKLALYRNTGTNLAPSFKEVSTDYAGLSAYSTGAGGLQGLNPAFGDLDGDGRPDMLVGDATGNLNFFKNMGDTLASFPAITIPQYHNINVGQNAAPFIYDLNGDSLPDLIIGNANGTLSYYWNYGTSTNPMFSTDSVNANLGHVNVTLSGDPLGFSQPFIQDSAGTQLLYAGSYRGTIFEYEINTANLRSGAFTLVDSNFLHYDAGAKATMQACDLNGDGKMEYLVGNARGGLQLFSESVWDSSLLLTVKEYPVQGFVSIYPNPAKDQFTCTFNNINLKNARVELYNMLGQLITIPFADEDNRLVFSSALLQTGMYLVHIVSGSNTFCGKILIHR